MTESPAPPYVDDLEVGDRGPSRSLVLTRTDLVRYAGASGDFNPMHHDETMALAAGMPSVFGHGMLSAGFLAGAVTDFVGLGTLTRFRVRFTKQAWPDRTLTTEVEVRALDPDSDGANVELDCRVVDDQGSVILTGHAAARLPRRTEKAAT
ncbi:MAG TPA: MaoC/PaaZ C-terminal domain-containing protein [Mycobacteriales bacterium]|nr:MaoC/PaaZ C-terminal domain-containing protein [Mycobacteriales bacterium]